MKHRIISLVPSLTELLFDLGLSNEVVGITKFCVHPKKWFNNKTRIGGTKNVNIEKIRSLRPTLIIANKEENVKEQVILLQKVAPVYTTDISNLQDALATIQLAGHLTGHRKNAEKLINQISGSFIRLNEHLQKRKSSQPSPTTAYLIWQKPYMVAGGDTFIHDMMVRCGFQNYFQKHDRYPIVTMEDLAECDLVLLSSEPFPFSEKHQQTFQTQLPNATVVLVDGEMFSWYGSRLLKSAAYFTQLISRL